MNASQWRECKLGDVIELKRGYDLPKSKRCEGNVPIISSAGESGFHNEAKVKGPGVVTGRYGTLGKVFYIEKDFWPLNTALYVKDFKGNYPCFISYFVTQLNFSGQNVAGAVPGVNRNYLHMLDVVLPTVDVQHQIADVLSTYDSLIENNNRRIVILGEMAQSLYREWFVKFFFPDYEGSKFIDSPLGKIPEGWEVVGIDELIKRYQTGKKYNNKTALPVGSVPILDQGKSGIIGYHNDEPGVIASEDDPIIVFANHTCYQKIIQYPFSAIQNMLPFKSIDGERERDLYWLHYVTKDMIEFNDYKGHWPEFISKKVILPPKELCSDFGEFTKSIEIQKYKFECQVNKLKQQRDMLLPKLISGNISLAS